MVLDIKTEFDHPPRAYLTYLIMDNLYSAMVHNFKSEFIPRVVPTQLKLFGSCIKRVLGLGLAMDGRERPCRMTTGVRMAIFTYGFRPWIHFAYRPKCCSFAVRL